MKARYRVSWTPNPRWSEPDEYDPSILAARECASLKDVEKALSYAAYWVHPGHRPGDETPVSAKVRILSRERLVKYGPVEWKFSTCVETPAFFIARVEYIGEAPKDRKPSGPAFVGTPRPPCEIAWEIRRVWRNPHYAAVPYLSALSMLGSAQEDYYEDRGKDVALRFLANASFFRGDDARRLKAELKAAYGIK